MLCNTSGSSFALLLLRPSLTTTRHNVRIAEIPIKHLASADNDVIFFIPAPDAVSAVAADLAVFNAHSLTSRIPDQTLIPRISENICRMSFPFKTCIPLKHRHWFSYIRVISVAQRCDAK
jgi:hypothetical protein